MFSMNPDFRSLFFLILGLLILPFDLMAETPKSQYASQLVSLRKSIETTKTENLEETSKLQLLKLYFETEDHLEDLVALQVKVQISQNLLKDLPDNIKQLEKKNTHR